MAQLNTDVSVVDFLKSTGKDSSFTARTSLAKEYGITNYTGSAGQNTQLLNALKGSTPATPTNIGNMNDATKFINSNQDADISSASAADEPPVRNVAQDLTTAFKDLTGKSSLVPSVALPSSPNFEDTFLKMRQQYGIDGLENTVNDLDAQEQDLQAQLRISKNDELGKPVAMGVIAGRVSEQERNFMERIDFVQRQKTRAINQIKAANDTIENIMTFRKMDYDVAKDNYNTEFANNITLFNTIKGVYELQLSEQDRVQDSARSNLQIIYNSIQDGGADIATLDDATKVKITKMELEAGLPQGFYQSLQSQKPDAKILSTTTRTSAGKKYADIIYQNSDGSLTTSQVLLGATNESGGGGSEADLEREARGKIVTYFNGLETVTPEQYKAARKAWVADVKGATPSEFDEIFARDYLDQEQYDAAGVSLF